MTEVDTWFGIWKETQSKMDYKRKIGYLLIILFPVAIDIHGTNKLFSIYLVRNTWQLHTQKIKFNP